jgi:hypothetical protein
MTADEDPDVIREQELFEKFWAVVCEASDAKPAVIGNACARALTNLIAAHAPDLENALAILACVTTSMMEDIEGGYPQQREQMQEGAAEGWRMQ